MRHFEVELEELNKQLLEMCALVASSVQRSVLSLIDKNEDLAHQVLRDETRVDQMENQIDELAMRLIIHTQPVAKDMRFIIGAIKIDTDLERMGDLAVHIVERALLMMHDSHVEGAEDIPKLSKLVESMVLASLDSFVKGDVETARKILESDDAVDKLRNSITQELTAAMQRDPASIPHALDLMIVARQLERIADHATNIAEDVIFMINGEEVRHHPLDIAEGAPASVPSP
ncbi:MAG TPA: phosphate signaling complex protein PhoU [Bryobacterales bacterium]|nr:phosphate signaling complex protein PhoU [Bryobacterales bacterium]